MQEAPHLWFVFKTGGGGGVLFRMDWFPIPTSQKLILKSDGGKSTSNSCQYVENKCLYVVKYFSYDQAFTVCNEVFVLYVGRRQGTSIVSHFHLSVLVPGEERSCYIISIPWHFKTLKN